MRLSSSSSTMSTHGFDSITSIVNACRCRVPPAVVLELTRHSGARDASQRGRRRNMKCASCKSDVVPDKPRTVWKLLTVAFWIGALATSLVFSLLLGLVGIAARRMSSATCPACKAEMAQPVHDAGERTDRTPQGRLVPRTV
jgi:hypothetical protein